MYVDYEYYTGLYGDDVKESVFNLLVWEACKKVDYHTTGVDGIKKLKHFFPTEEDDAESVKRCICKLIDTMNQSILAEEAERNAQSYIIREDGTMHRRAVSSISAGNESISFTTKRNTDDTSGLLHDEETKIVNIINEYLSGVKDSNGVNLLHMGEYPRIGAII